MAQARNSYSYSYSYRSGTALLFLLACCAELLATTLLADDLSARSSRWYKGNTHTHSLWSDGGEFPEMVADWYKGHGYDFLAISDHNRVMAGERWRNVDTGKKAVSPDLVESCRKRFGADWLDFRDKKDLRQVRLKTFDEVSGALAEPGTFLLIPSEEVTSRFRDRRVHVVAMNVGEVIPAIQGSSVPDTLDGILSAVALQSQRLGRPILAHVNHPNWKDFDISPEDLARASAARFFEVCNAGPGSRQYGDANHPGVEALWDVANTIRIAKMKMPPLFAIASDDAHDFRRPSPKGAIPGRAWIMVRAERLDADALIHAMNRGDFYASTGVVLSDVFFDARARVISVEVVPRRGVRNTIEFIGTLDGPNLPGRPGISGDGTERSGQIYSTRIGQVLSVVKGDSATYQLTGKELYVRVVVRTNRPIKNAPKNGVRNQEAWCQPMGWKH